MARRGEYLQSEVLKILRRHAGPLSAYDILDEMRKSDAKMAPTTIYRTLAALSEKHAIHRLESMNAYVLCKCGSDYDASILSICNDCGVVEENVAPHLLKDLTSLLGKSGFSARRHVIEVHGTCGDCIQDETHP